MKPCVYCGQDIPDSAKKCSFCHSFQNPLDEPKKPADSATLVIQFVGWIATVGAVSIAVLGIFGIKSVSDLADRANKLMDQTTENLKKFESTRRDLDALVMRQAYARYEGLMESFAINEIYNSPGVLNDLKRILETVSRIEPASDDGVAQADKVEITSVVASVAAYANAQFEDAVKAIATTLPEDSFRKHLLLAAGYTGIWYKTRDHDVAAAATMLERAISEARVAAAWKGATNRQHSDAQIDLAVTLIFRSASGDLDEAYKSLTDAKKYTTRLSVIDDNIAGLYAKKHDLDRALESLEEAKKHGDFSTAGDVDYFLQDGNFEELRKSAGHQERLRQLLNLAP